MGCSSTGSSSTAARATRERHLADAQEEEAEARAAVLADSVRDDLANGRSLVDTKRQGVCAAAAPSSWRRRRSSSCARSTRRAPSPRSICSRRRTRLVGAQEALAQSRFDLAVADLTLRNGRDLPAPLIERYDFGHGRARAAVPACGQRCA